MGSPSQSPSHYLLCANTNQELAPPGVKLPPGVPIIYTVELTEVLNSYL